MINNSIAVNLYKLISEANEEREMKEWHASSLAQCPKAQYMKRLGIVSYTQPTGAKILRWQAGHNIEEAIRPHVTSLYKDVSSNVRLRSEELDLTGEYDNYDADSKRIIEIKSGHDSAFKDENGVTGLKLQDGLWPEGTRWAGKAKWKMNPNPYTHHEWQNYCYKLLLEEKGLEVQGIDYVYISLAGRLVTYSTEISDEIMVAVKARIRLLNEAWKSKTPPQCICKIGDFDNREHPMWGGVLQWCDYRRDNDCCKM